ncbi:MAG: ATP-binding protein, partial [Candidatus Cloacimonetes bacterium]|nr:ATP-binding protein [Candidatus Cloacimonadota bacterium]
KLGHRHFKTHQNMIFCSQSSSSNVIKIYFDRSNGDSIDFSVVKILSIDNPKIESQRLNISQINDYAIHSLKDKIVTIFNENVLNALKSLKAFSHTSSHNFVEKIVKDFPYHNSSHFISSIAPLSVLVKEQFDFIQENDLEDKVTKALKIIDSNISKVKVIGDQLKIRYGDSRDYMSLSYFGEGISRFFAVFIGIVLNKDKAIFVDEIENGIHYTKLPHLWETIFKLSKEYNCQVFATTHSKECIEAFNEQRKKEEDVSRGAYFKLYRVEEESKTFADNIDVELLDYQLRNDFNFRG